MAVRGLLPYLGRSSVIEMTSKYLLSNQDLKQQ
ncbi:hypothetical protein F442_22557 [Phytophthora nicotianae P10297]|uniref:Uncharacterized protein n=1 Tax=Phytophthora nicotianae P10297 TaxID=1317064 RepID=W2XZ64_PHYNI|nr:hypothetical protein F442_22557 [Phytophthora nicotianae P10297]